MKKRSIAKLLSLLLAALLVLSACSGNTGSENPSSENSSGSEAVTENTANPTTENTQEEEPSNTETVSNEDAISDLVLYVGTANELENFMLQNTNKSKDTDVLCNAISPLLEVDNRGQLQPAVATAWSADADAVTWTFTLRNDVTWVDVDGNYKADCTAQDWLTGLEWVLNYGKSSGVNAKQIMSMVDGAKDYYDFTQALSESDPAACMALNASSEEFTSMVKVEAPDDYTLVYHCFKSVPYFDTMCACACLYPLSQALVDEVGAENMAGISNLTMWYSGPYRVTEFIQGNSKVLEPNESYWDTDCTRFDSVTIRVVDDMTLNLYETGEIDQVALSSSDQKTIASDEGHEFYNQLIETRPRKYSYSILFNYAKNNEDGTPDTNWNTAIANENFRKSIYYGLDMSKIWATYNNITPNNLEDVCYTMKGLCYFSDGTDYVERVVEKLEDVTPMYDGGTGRYNADLAAQYRDAAIEELTAQGVTFPVEVDYYIASGAQSAEDKAIILKEMFEDIGPDYITVNILTYVSSFATEVSTPSLHGIYEVGWGADYGDPENFLNQMVSGDTSASYAKYTKIADVTNEDLLALWQEYTDMVSAAAAITNDADARYEGFSDAEAYMLNHAICVPGYYYTTWQLTHVNDYTKMNALYGMQNSTFKNWVTSKEAYTTEQYAQFKADFESGK